MQPPPETWGTCGCYGHSSVLVSMLPRGGDLKYGNATISEAVKRTRVTDGKDDLSI
jgi:hypothetical protein